MSGVNVIALIIPVVSVLPTLCPEPVSAVRSDLTILAVLPVPISFKLFDVVVPMFLGKLVGVTPVISPDPLTLLTVPIT